MHLWEFGILTYRGEISKKGEAAHLLYSVLDTSFQDLVLLKKRTFFLIHVPVDINIANCKWSIVKQK